MGPKRRRPRLDEEELANASDSDDNDWSEAPRTRTPRKQTKTKVVGRKVPRRTRRGSDVVSDDDDISMESFTPASSSDSDVEMNPSTGRPMRSAAKQKPKYEESDEDEEQDEVEASDDDLVKPNTRKLVRGRKTRGGSRQVSLPPSRQSSRLASGSETGRQSRIVKFKLDPKALQSVTPHSRPQSTRSQTPQALTLGRSRRSSRISHEDEPLLELSNYGKRGEVARQRTRSPSVEASESARPTVATKKMPGYPSTIMEASQETSQKTSQQAGAAEEDEPEHEDEAVVAETVPNSQSPSAHAGQEEAQEEQVILETEDEDIPVTRNQRARLQSLAKGTSTPRGKKRKRNAGESSDFDYNSADDDDEDDELSDSGKARRKNSNGDSQESMGNGRYPKRRSMRQPSQRASAESELDADELAEEARELESGRTRNKRRRVEDIVYDGQPKLRSRNSQRPDYRIFRPEMLQENDDDEPAPTFAPSRNRRVTGGFRSLFPVAGPFGGATAATGLGGGDDSDSSDDDVGVQPAGGVGATPTAARPGLLPHNNEAVSSIPANVGKVKDKKLLADADPLGVDQNVTFEGVGGLGGHINQLKEMVALPLLYPEVFQQFHVTPPRGVLFHGPPGTGKTLLARALASSVSSHGKKVTFYMRKGADALSKWVGEAERQLRLLFEEARKNQPSIIFFDEIDGLAPVRSSKQEQIHASIVATLLALMDGMDGRGQVIVIGATNRPDNVDPALRRPGRFDREFYFPLPDEEARRAIINIHTKGWDPPLKPEFKDQLAGLTKGYGGADLRALCTEAALNAVQGTYPQIYNSDKKLVIDPARIRVLAKDFMISVNKMVPSSERSASSGAAPLAKDIEPLLRTPLREIIKILDDMIPHKKKLTPLEEAQFDDRDDEHGFQREVLARGFEKARIFRPRLLVHGMQGMGQQYLGGALLNKFEGLHVQSFDLASLMEDSTMSPEATVVRLFKEVRRHKPSVIYIPNVDVWYQTIGPAVIKTFTTLLRSIPPNDPILLLGIMESYDPNEKPDPAMLRDLFGFSTKNMYKLKRPDAGARSEYFSNVIGYIRMSPRELPTGENRKKRILEELEIAPEPKQAAPTKENVKQQEKSDRATLNQVKIILQPVMDLIKQKYRMFRHSIVDEKELAYLYDELNDGVLTTDLTEEQRREHEIFRPYEFAEDQKGEPCIRQISTGHLIYNLNTAIIEQRLVNGYYCRFKDFYTDIKRLEKDAHKFKDVNDSFGTRYVKAVELRFNVEVDVKDFETRFPDLHAASLGVYERSRVKKLKKQAEQSPSGRGLNKSPQRPEVDPSDSESPGGRDVGQHGQTSAQGGPTGSPISRPLSPHSNGGSAEVSHVQSNGSTVPSRPEEDVHMSGTDIPYTPSVAAHVQPPPSQEGPHTHINKKFKASDYHNSASTTSSGQRTSHQSSGSQHPDLASMFAVGGSSQFPDTQSEPFSQSNSSSQPQQSGTQLAHVESIQSQAVPRSGNLANILNDSNLSPSNGIHDATATTTRDEMFTQPLPPFILNEQLIAKFHQELEHRTSGLSVEQLEQVNAAVMDAVYRTRGSWNRTHVVRAVQEAFNDTMADIEIMQKILPHSQEEEDDDEGITQFSHIGQTYAQTR